MTIVEYLSKMKGGAKSPPGVGGPELLWSWLGAMIGIGLCAFLSAKFFEPRDLTLLIGSFGASAVLVYSAIKSPLAQPRNLIGGHVISGLVGVACWQLFGGRDQHPWVSRRRHGSRNHRQTLWRQRQHGGRQRKRRGQAGHGRG